MKYRTKRISIRTTPKIKNELNKICNNNKITKSKFLDEVVKYVGRQDIISIKVQSKKSSQIFNSDSHIISQLETIINQINRIGNNLNQLTKMANNGRISQNLYTTLNHTNQIFKWTINQESLLENQFSKARTRK